MATVNEEIQDRLVAHQIGLIRVSGSIRNKVVAHLNRVEDDLMAQIARRGDRGRFTDNRMNLILNDVRKALDDARPETLAIVRDELVGVATNEVDFNKRLINGAVGIDMNLAGVNQAQLRAAVLSRPFQGRLLREWVSSLDNQTRRNVRDAVRIGFTEGETIDQMARRIRGTRAAGFRDGVMEITRRGAQAMVRTAVNHTATAAREELFAANEDLIKGVRWVSTLDSRVTPICAARDGKVYPVNEGPRPPAHVACRSVSIPVLKSARQSGIDANATRASMDGQVPAKTTYNEWLKRQPVDVQNEALGVQKATLFRQGGLSVDKFVDPRGRELTLDQLRVRESAAFERAGL